MDNWNTIRSYTNPINTRTPYKVYIQNPSLGKIQLEYAPDGWDKFGFSYSRSKTYSGIFRKYSIDKLGFVKDGKRRLERIESEQGFEAEVVIIVEELDLITLTYLEVFRGNAKLITKNQSELKYEVTIADSDFEDKVINRDKEKIIVTKKTQDEVYKSIDGGVIEGFANEKITLTLPSRIDFLNNALEADRSFTGLNRVVPPLIKTSGEDDSVKSNSNEYASINGAFYSNSTGVSVNIDINGSFNFTIDFFKNQQTINNITISLLVFDNADSLIKTVNVNYDAEFVREFPFGQSGILAIYNLSGVLNIQELISNTHYIQFVVDGAFNSGNYIFDFTLRTQGGLSPQRNIEAVLRHNEYARILQKITGVSNPFYSDYFGGTFTEPRKYDFNGKGALRATTNGALIRGFKMTNNVGATDVIAPLSVSLRDQFESDNTIDPIGMGIEEINGKKVVRIEERKYFYDTRVSLYIDNATNIEEEYNKDIIYNSLEVGYSKVESDEVQDGIYDYNNKAEYVNAIISNEQKLSLISKYSASNASINAARKETKEENPTTDSKYDKLNFIIDVVENDVPNVVLNPNADNGLTDWSTTGDVSVQNIISNNRFVLTGGDGILWQDLGSISQPTFSFSYGLISENELTLTPLAQLSAQLNDGSYKSLDQNGNWIDGQVSFPLDSIKGVKESALQSMFSFQIAANEPLENVNSVTIWFYASFLNNQTGENKYIIDDVYVSNEGKYKARTTEGFESITGIVNSNESYNINFAPARNAIRHGFVLRAPLDDKQNTSYVFSDSEKISNLVSKKPNEPEVKESTDILVGDLEEPIWSNKLITFDAKFSTQQKRDIGGSFEDGKQKIYGLVAYRENTRQEYKYGWINDLNTGGFQGDGSVELIPISKYVNVASVTYARDDDGAIFIDDDGARFTIEI